MGVELGVNFLSIRTIVFTAPKGVLREGERVEEALS
jgi:hypothetical protein